MMVHTGDRYRVLHAAVTHLAAHDADMATTQNAMGFNRFDGRVGHQLARKAWEDWDEADVYTAWRLVQKYRITQLKPAGIDLSGLTAPLAPEQDGESQSTRLGRRLTRGTPHASIDLSPDESRFVIRFGGDDRNWSERLSAVREVAGAKFDKQESCWMVPINVASIEQMTALVARSQAWEVPFHYAETMPTQIDNRMTQWQERIVASNAKESTLEVAGLKDGMILRPFQKAGVEFVLQTGRCLIADEMGTGKTIQSIATIVSANAYPALIICPSSLKLNWAREFRMWVDRDLTIQIARGRKDAAVDPDADVVIMNYDIAKDWVETLVGVQWQAVVCDESHSIKTPNSQRTRAVKKVLKATRPRIRILLSGTPILNRPIELWTQIEALGYDTDFGGYWGYVNRYCDPKKGDFGLDTSGASNLNELNSLLRSTGAMIRRLKKDVLTELPSKQWSTVPIEMSASGSTKYRKAERNLSEWIGERKAENAERQAEWRHAGAEQGLEGRDLARYMENQRKAYASTEASKAARNEQLLRFTELKKLAYAGKQKGVFEWIDDFLDSTDKKLIVFGWHRDVVDGIADRYHAPKIQGGMTQDAVEDGKNQFQTDPDVRVIVCNIAAGGVGHTLTAASDVLFTEFPWNPAMMDQAIDRAHRIGQRDSVNGWQMVATHPDGEGTIDTEITDIIATKRAVVDEATDGFGAATQINMMQELAKRLTGDAGGIEE